MLNTNEIVLLRSIVTELENYICNCCPCITPIDVCTLFPKITLFIPKLETIFTINSLDYAPTNCYDIDTIVTTLATELQQHGEVEDSYYKDLLSYSYLTIYNIIRMKEPELLSYFNIQVVKDCLNEDFQDCVAVEVSDIVIIPIVTNPSCDGSSDGQISLSVSGGAGFYTYLWEDDSDLAIRTNLAEGDYSIIVTDGDGNTGSLTISLVAPFAINILGLISPIRSASGTGSINLSISGGTAPYTYLWNTTVTTQNISGLIAGTYNVIVTDSKGCTATAEFTLDPFISISLTATNIACNGDNTGEISVTVVGGTAPFTYLWNIGASTATIENLTVGNYSVRVTDANDNIVQAAITLTQPSALRYSLSIQQPTTVGGTGTITITVAGGVSPYTYLWSDSSTNSSISGVAGTYSVLITDSNGCTLEVTDINLYNPMLCNSVVVLPTCHGNSDGTINLTVTGGVEPYTYDWTDGVTTQNRIGLSAGTYEVMITDNGGRYITKTVVVNDLPELTLTATVNQITQSVLGNILVTPSGGSGAYTYAWSNGKTTNYIDKLNPGTYTVVVTDTNGCSVTEDYVIHVFGFSLTLLPTHNTCHGESNGEIVCQVTGGTAPYNYYWSTLETTANIVSLPAGLYSVQVTDAFGQVETASVTITEPTAITIAEVVVNPTVGNSNGTITLTVTGGSPYIDSNTGLPFYEYLWENESTNKDRTGLSPGTYTVVVTDASGCTSTAIFTLTVEESFLATINTLNVYETVAPTTPGTYEFSLIPTGSTSGQIGFKFPDNFTLNTFQIFSNGQYVPEDLNKWTLTTANGYKTYTYTYMTGDSYPYNEFVEIVVSQDYIVTII